MKARLRELRKSLIRLDIAFAQMTGRFMDAGTRQTVSGFEFEKGIDREWYPVNDYNEPDDMIKGLPEAPSESRALPIGAHRTPPKGYPKKKSKYAIPTEYKYPIDTEKHVRSAMSYFSAHGGQYSSEEQKSIWKRIVGAARGFGIEVSDEVLKRAGMKKSRSFLTFGKAKYIKRWKGKDNKWQYEYKEGAGGKGGKKTPASGTPEYHEHKIAVDTVKNPLKGQFLGGPSAAESKEKLKTKFGYSDADIAKLEGKESGDTAKVSNAGQYGTHIMKNPAGTYSFVGNVPVNAMYAYKDSSDKPLSAEHAKEIQQASNPAMVKQKYGIVTRTFKTMDEAKAFHQKISGASAKSAPVVSGGVSATPDLHAIAGKMTGDAKSGYKHIDKHGREHTFTPTGRTSSIGVEYEHKVNGESQGKTSTNVPEEHRKYGFAMKVAGHEQHSSQGETLGSKVKYLQTVADLRPGETNELGAELVDIAIAEEKKQKGGAKKVLGIRQKVYDELKGSGGWVKTEDIVEGVKKKLGGEKAQKSIDIFELTRAKYLDINPLEKGKKLPVGTIREWNGQKYQKKGDGKWGPVQGEKRGGAKGGGVDLFSDELVDAHPSRNAIHSILDKLDTGSIKKIVAQAAKEEGGEGFPAEHAGRVRWAAENILDKRGKGASGGSEAKGTPRGKGGSALGAHVGGISTGDPRYAQTVRANLNSLKGKGIDNPVFDKEHIKGYRDPSRKGKIDVHYKDPKTGKAVYLHSTNQHKTVGSAVDSYINLMGGVKKSISDFYELLKAKYLRRWKGKDNKWRYEYTKPGGKGKKAAAAEVPKTEAGGTSPYALYHNVLSENQKTLLKQIGDQLKSEGTRYRTGTHQAKDVRRLESIGFAQLFEGKGGVEAALTEKGKAALGMKTIAEHEATAVAKEKPAEKKTEPKGEVEGISKELSDAGVDEKFHKAVGEFLKDQNYSVDDIKNVTDGPYGYGQTIEVGGEDWAFMTEQDADDAAHEDVKSIADDMGIESFSEGFQETILDKYVKKDWFDDALREMQESYANDIKDEGSRKFDNRLIEEAYDAGIIDDDDFEKDEDGDPDYSAFTGDADDLADKYAAHLVDSVGDSADYYRSNFGDEAFSQVVKDNDLIDWDGVADEAVQMDGRGHFLSHYDGNEHEYGDHLAYRLN